MHTTTTDTLHNNNVLIIEATGLKKRASKDTWEDLEGGKGRGSDVISIFKTKIIFKK